jgi:hypothetical protein
MLPGLSALRWAGVELGVKIRLAHLAEELFETWGTRSGWLQDEPALREAQVDWGVVAKADFLGKCLGDPHGEAIAPTLDSGSHVALRRYLQ